MAAPVYHIVFHEGHWRVGYDGLYLGEFETAAKAGETALKIANSRVAPSPDTQITSDLNGEITVGNLGDKP